MSQVGEFPALDDDDAIAILRSDHAMVENLLGVLVQPGDRTMRRTMLNRLKAVLAVHNATEESLVYPATRVLADLRSVADRLYRETAEADVLLFEIDNLPDDDNDRPFDEKIAKLREAILAHVRDEEANVFPKLVDAAGADGLKRLTQSMREFRSNFERVPSRSQVRDVEGMG